MRSRRCYTCCTRAPRDGGRKDDEQTHRLHRFGRGDSAAHHGTCAAGRSMALRGCDKGYGSSPRGRGDSVEGTMKKSKHQKVKKSKEGDGQRAFDVLMF